MKINPSCLNCFHWQQSLIFINKINTINYSLLSEGISCLTGWRGGGGRNVDIILCKLSFFVHMKLVNPLTETTSF